MVDKKTHSNIVRAILIYIVTVIASVVLLGAAFMAGIASLATANLGALIATAGVAIIGLIVISIGAYVYIAKVSWLQGLKLLIIADIIAAVLGIIFAPIVIISSLIGIFLSLHFFNK